MNKLYAFPKPSLRALGCTLALAAVFGADQVQAQLNVAVVNTAYTINFDGTVGGVGSGVFAGTGFQPTPVNGRLDSDAWATTGWSDGSLAFGGTAITSGTDFRRGLVLAPTSAGGIYAFDDGAGGVLNGRALGFQPGAADFTPGSITLRVQNNTGSTLTAFDIAYNAYYRNDQDWSNDFDLYVSDNNTSYTHITSQDVTSPAAQAGTAWVANARSVTVSGYNVPNGQYFYIRWQGNDVTGSGSRDEFALDDISVTGRAYTLVRWTAASSTANESAGTTVLTASIINPHPVNPTTVDAVLTSGPAARINNYTTQTLTFPGGSLANQNLTITITDNGACDGNAIEVLTLQNVLGGITPSVGVPAAHTLTVDDDETASATFAQFFDAGPGDNWNITAGAGNQSSNTGAADFPASQRILSGTQSWQVNNGTVTLELATVDVTDWTNIVVEARLSSTSVTSGNGAEGADSVAFYADVDGNGFPSDADISISGNSNRRFGYNAVNDTFTVAGTPKNVVCNLSGNGRDYSTVRIFIPDGSTSLALRVIAKNNDAAEIWNVDNIQVTGTLCSPVYYSRANGSETTATWSTSRTGSPAPSAVTFNKNATMVVQNAHTVTSTSNASIALRNLNVETGGALSLAGVSNVEINGPTLDIDGTLTATNDNFDLVSSELTSISGSATAIEVNDLTLDGFGAIVTTSTLRIRGTLQLDNGNFNGNSNEVQLISNATGTARLGPVAPTASYSSLLRLERYIPAGVTDWRLLCSPMASNTVADWTDDFFTAGFPGSAYPNFIVSGDEWPSVRKYNEALANPTATDTLSGVVGTSEPMTVGRGFAAWSGTTLASTTAFTIDVRGVPTVASTPFSIPLTYTNNSLSTDGLNLVGNPLPSPVDFTDFTLANVDNNYYIYDPGSGTNAAWDEVSQIGTGGANGNIQSSQGFWLKANAAGPSATLSENAKVLEPINGGIFSDVSDDRNMVRLHLSDAAYTRTDEAVVHFIAGEPGFNTPDMVKLSFANDAAAFISTEATTGEDLVINAYGELIGAVDVPVKVQVPASGDYVISLSDVAAISGRACMVLEDLATGNTVQVVEDAVLAFSIDAAAPVEPARFVLHVGTPVTTSVHNALCATSNDGFLEVSGPGSGDWTFSLVQPGGDVTVQGPSAGPVQFNNLGSGEHTLFVEGNTGCGALSQMILIDAPGLLAAEAQTFPATCAGTANGSVEVNVMGGTEPYTFAWNNGAEGATLVDAAPGTYQVSVTDGNGCTTELVDLLVGAGAGPVAAFEMPLATIVLGEEAFFFNTGTYDADYLWSFGDGTTSTENEPVYTYSEVGTFTVTLTTMLDGCEAIASQDLSVVDATGMASATSAGLSAWTEGAQFIVQWQTAGADGIRAEVVDAAGRKLIERSAKGSSGRVAIPASELPAGVYNVRVFQGDAQRTFKLPVVR